MARQANPSRRAPRGRQRASASASEGDLSAIKDPVDLARSTLQVICRDANSPAAARAQAARTLLELTGALKSGAPDAQKPASEMSAAEIDARLADLGDADTR